MDVVWVVLLGLLLGGYFVVDGFDIGTGVLLRRLGRTEGERRMLITAIGPFFLGNEVWLVAVGGVLSGAFPLVEDRALGGLYPLVASGLLIWVLRDAAVWFRSRQPSSRWRAGWDRLLVAASTAFAAFWGMVVGAALAGLPEPGTTAGAWQLTGPYALLWAAVLVTLFAAHGAIFLVVRLRDDMATRARETAAHLLRPAAALLVLAVGAGAVFVLPREWSVVLPVTGIGALAAGALWAANAAVRADRHARALVLSSAAVASPVLMVLVRLAAQLPEGTADAGTLRTLGGIALAVLPLLAAAQTWMWRAFRRPVDAGTVVFF